jgi:hypothetical protein
MNTPTAVEDFLEDLSLEWRPLGDRENVGIVRSGSSPAQALTERITNGIDAVIEKAVLEQDPDLTPESPRDAVVQCFGGSEIGFNHQDQQWVGELARNNLSLKMHEGTSKDTPVIEIKDEGIGQPPEDFPDTFLSLNENSKVTKPYLIGKYGQGGSNTFDFCEYAIILSRSIDGGDLGWSIVRYNPRIETEETYSDGVFEYCVLDDGSIPYIDEKHADGFEGSLIRLIEYDASSFSNILGPGSGSLYTVVDEQMFGSIFPFYLEDHRTERFGSYDGSPRRRTKVGSRFRLDKPAKDVDESREFKTIEVGDLGELSLKYWVLEDTDSVAQFADKTSPVVFTLHGQRHHAEPKRLLKQTNHSFLKDRLIVEVDCEGLTQKGKRIFSSTRDRASEGSEYRQIRSKVKQSLKHDDKLEELNRKYKQRALSQTSEEEEERAKELLSELLRNPDPGSYGDSRADGGQQDGGRGDGGGGDGGRDPVTPRHKYPTFVEIDNTADPIEAKQGRTMRVRLKSDVKTEFEQLDRGEFRLELNENLEDVLEYRNETSLEEGWKTYQLEVDGDAEVGTEGEIKAVVEWPDGYKEDKGDVTIVEPPEETGRRATEIEPPEIRRVNKEQEEARSTLGWDDDDSVVEYVSDGDGPGTVFVAMFNSGIQPIRETNDTQNIVEQRDRQYAAYISYWEMMRHREVEEQDLDPEEEYVHREKNRTARMLMRSISEGMNPEEMFR